ncbi:MAG: hypothetical protein JW910_02010 [Anaerolineae bacterium]|nr:hypothetical protein [Anaerolineae bacterium]
MITQDVMIGKILAHLNGDLTETELIHWVEDVVVVLTESHTDVSNEDTLLDVLMYIGAGDTPGFPLTWAVLSDFLARLGQRVRVVPERA